MTGTVLHMYTIYAAPADFPSVPFVVRGWLVGPGGQLQESGELALADTLEQARRYIPVGMACLPRWEGDEPQVVESWL